MRRTVWLLGALLLAVALTQGTWVGPVRPTLSPIPDQITASAVSLTGEVANLPPGRQARARLQVQVYDPATGKWTQTSTPWDSFRYVPPDPAPPAKPPQGVLLSAYDGCIGPCAAQPPLAWKSRQKMMYKPRQFGAGAVLDLANPTRKRVIDPGPYAGSDFLATNEEADWGTLFTLTRAARVGVGLYGPLPGELQAAGWVRGADIVTTPSYKDDGRQTVPTYWKTFPAGTHALPPFGDVSPVILFREADDSPSKPPAYPAGLEQPIPNQECPAWVHESYRVKGVDGVWRDGWHGAIDPTYWCYFDHEHGSKPPAVMEPLIAQGLTAFSFGYAAEKANKTAFCTSCHAPLEEYPEGNKNYAFRWEGNEWVVTFHAATGKTNIAVNEHHSWGLTVADASGRLLALVQLMADTGYAESAHDNRKIIHPKALPAQNPRDRFGAHRGLPFTDQQGYGPFAAVNFDTLLTTGSRSYINVDWVLRCEPSPLIKNPFDPSDPELYHTCATMRHTGGLNLDRWFNVPGGDEGRGFCVVYNPAVDATDGRIDGWGYTDPLALEPRKPSDPDAVRQFVAPDLPGGQLCQVTELRFVADGFAMRYFGVGANQNNSAYPYYEKAIKLGGGVPLN